MKQKDIHRLIGFSISNVARLDNLSPKSSLHTKKRMAAFRIFFLAFCIEI